MKVHSAVVWRKNIILDVSLDIKLLNYELCNKIAVPVVIVGYKILYICMCVIDVERFDFLFW